MKIKELRRRVLSFPAPLQKMLYLRSVVMSAPMLFFVILLFVSGDYRLLLPPGLLFTYLLIDCVLLYLRFSSGDYMCLTGKCMAVEKSLLRQRPKWILMEVEGARVIIRLAQYRIIAKAGDMISVYLSPGSPVSKEEETPVIYRYYTICSRPGLIADRQES